MIQYFFRHHAPPVINAQGSGWLTTIKSRITLKATFMAAMLGMAGVEAEAADYNQNPFTLTYGGALAKNEPGKVNIHPVPYKLNGLDIAANIYTPANYDAAKNTRWWSWRIPMVA